MVQDAYHINYVDVTLDGDHYLIPRYAHHRPAAQVMLSGKLYEVNTHKIIEHILKETGKSILHAGTFFGDMLPKFSKYTQDKLYAFEPVLENYVMAKRCVQINDLKNVVIFNAALSDKTGHLYIKTKGNNGQHLGGMSYVTSDNRDDTQLANSIRIDDLTLNELSVLHLDVEGHEITVINGAINKIKEDEPVILMEDSKSKDTSIIEDLGYELLLRTNLIDVWATKKYKNISQKIVDNLQ